MSLKGGLPECLSNPLLKNPIETFPGFRTSLAVPGNILVLIKQGVFTPLVCNFWGASDPGVSNIMI